MHAIGTLKQFPMRTWVRAAAKNYPHDQRKRTAEESGNTDCYSNSMPHSRWKVQCEAMVRSVMIIA